MDGSEAHGATVLQHANIIYINIYVCKKKMSIINMYCMYICKKKISKSKQVCVLFFLTGF